jgi:hypothetical protein
MLTQEKGPASNIVLPNPPVTPTEPFRPRDEQASAPPTMVPPLEQEQQTLPTPTVSPEPPQGYRRGHVGGALAGFVLIMLGMVLFISNVWNAADVGLLVLPTLGAIFLAWGLVERHPPLLIPASILLGLGLGVLLQQTALIDASSAIRGGIVVLGLSLGFLAIIPLVAPFEQHLSWWPVIPGGVLLVVALAIFSGPGGIAFLQAIGPYWPLALVAAGVALLWIAYSARGRGPNDADRQPHTPLR